MKQEPKCIAGQEVKIRRAGVLKAIHFQNFRVLQNATLPLSRVTVLAGPNGSGKSTVLQALRILGGVRPNYESVVSIDHRNSRSEVKLRFLFDHSGEDHAISIRWKADGFWEAVPDRGSTSAMEDFASRVRVFSFNMDQLAESVHISPAIELGPNGAGLAGVLDNLDDQSRERFEAVNEELSHWLPDFDQIRLEVPDGGRKAFSLRRKSDGLSIRAVDLSEGTLFALALLTLSHLPVPPSLVALEHPDAGIHPRLLRRVQDAIYRLAYPEQYGEKRVPTQVVATTHSPFFLDLFKEHPEEIVFANKFENEVTFERLSDRPHVAELLPDGPLGDLWYSGLLGGVPSQS